MDMPTPTEAHRRLHLLAGQWGGEERIHPAMPDVAGGPATAFVINRVALDGFAVVQDYEQYRDGRPTFTGHGVFWWDEDAHQYVMTWFDSLSGAPADFRGGFDGDVLQLVHERLDGGFNRCTFDYGVPGEYVFTMELSADGQHWTLAHEGAYGLLPGPTARERKARVARALQGTRPAAARKADAARKTAARKTGKARKPGARKTAAKAAATRLGPASRTARRAAPKSTRRRK